VIVEIVRFQNPPNATREQLIEGALATVDHWRANPELIRKHYCASLDGQQGMGIYIWPCIEAARRGHDADWIAQAEARTGAPVDISYHDLLMVLDNAAGTLVQHPPSPV